MSGRKCLRDTLFIFAAERHMEYFGTRALPSGGVVANGWTVTVEGTDGQFPEDSDTLSAKLRDDAERGWLLAYDVEGDDIACAPTVVSGAIRPLQFRPGRIVVGRDL